MMVAAAGHRGSKQNRTISVNLPGLLLSPTYHCITRSHSRYLQHPNMDPAPRNTRTHGQAPRCTVPNKAQKVHTRSTSNALGNTSHHGHRDDSRPTGAYTSTHQTNPTARTIRHRLPSRRHRQPMHAMHLIRPSRLCGPIDPHHTSHTWLQRLKNHKNTRRYNTMDMGK